MSTTLNLNSVRFVKRVSSGASLSKYGYIGMMQSNAAALETAPWIRSELDQGDVTLTTNKLTLTDGVIDAATGEWTTKPTYTTYLSEKYDVYNQAGDAVAQMATFCGYAGCVAYRFALPTSETANVLQSITLAMQRDRYLRAGVRISMCLSSSETPSDDWSVVRGTAAGCVRSASTTPGEGVTGVASFGFLGQPDVANVSASRAADGSITFDTATAFADAASFQFLFVYLTLEDPAAYWDMYSATAKRQYYIEGSAMLMQDGCRFTFEYDPASASDSELVLHWPGGHAMAYDPQPSSGSPAAAFSAQVYAGSDYFMASPDGSPAVSAVTTDTNTTLVPAFSTSSPVVSQPYDGKRLAGLIACYSAFFRDAFVRADSLQTSSLGMTAGVGFSVGLGTGYSSGSTLFDDLGKTGPCFVARKKLLVPFSVPRKFAPKILQLDWEANGNFVSQNGILLRRSVWLLKGLDTMDYGRAELQRHELFTGEASSVAGWTMLDSFESDATAAGSRSIDIPPVGTGPNTLLLTCYLDMDCISLDSYGMPNAYKAGDGWRNIEVRSSGNFLVNGGAFEGGWNPKITIIGHETT